MPIPSDQDRQVALLDQQARGLIGQVVTIHWAGQKDKPRMQATLRERLKDFNDEILSAAEIND